MLNDLERFIEEELKDYKIVIVSNREPYEHQTIGSKIICHRPKGGLVTALEPVLNKCNGLWLAWGSGSADRQFVDSNDIIKVPPEDPSYSLKRIWLTDKEVENYYYLLSNRALWPLFHMMISKVFFREKPWREYKKVNKYFAESIIKECAGQEKSSIVWLHDFHLALVAKIIKEKAPNLKTSFFWHIPWPVWPIYDTFPKRKSLLEGLLANDILAFHTSRYAHNFLDCVKYILKVNVDYHNLSVKYQGHTTRVRIFPISIDFADIRKRSKAIKDEKAVIKKLGLEKIIAGKIVGIGVDRMDYTKGIYEKLLAVNRFLEKHPEYKNKFVFIQKSSLTRTKLKTYRDYKHEVNSLIHNINQKHGTDDWKPIVHITKPFDQDKIIALYKVADFCFVNSLMDGMNLVSKEYIAAKTKGDGVLICSRYAGVVNELGANLIEADPRDIEDLADKMYQAVNMKQSTMKLKMKRMQDYLKYYDIYEWAKANLLEIVGLMGN